ncbi:MAG: phosphopantetheine-binding protein [Paludibacteraceae bacterium]|nr:phosphopantetheine-binding protein [Paludibacteraceae bacterium]
MENLIEQLKQQIIEELNLEDTTPADIDPAAPLFGDGGIGLDSIDALEITMLLEKYYGIKISDPKEARTIYSSINSIAEYIKANQK